MYEGDQWEGLCISLNVEKFHVWEFFLHVCIGPIYLQSFQRPGEGVRFLGRTGADGC